MSKPLTELFLNEKPAEALVNIYREKENYSGKLANDINTTDAHALNIVNDLEDRDLVERRQEGRRKIASVTEEGKKVAKPLAKALEAMREVEADK